jgi:4'-phosphopantetheinyl transferase
MLTAPRDHEVHIWRAPLDVSAPLLARLAAMLSVAESDRAMRLRRPEDRVRHTAAHGWLRHLLGAYLDSDAAGLTFTADERGKPRLTHPDAAWLRFNLSHSGALAAIAVARNREVGVDIERLREDVDIDGVSRRFFTPDQRAQLVATAPPARAGAFFAMWARHEAALKATGTGLAGTHVPAAQSAWTVQAFDAGPEYAAAVAVQGVGAQVPRAAAELSL